MAQSFSAIVLILLVCQGVAAAEGPRGATAGTALSTSPLVPRENNDLIQCQIVNVGTRDRSVRILILDGAGNALVDTFKLPAPPGVILVSAIAMPKAGGEVLTPGFCRFELEGRGDEFRAAGAIFQIRTGVTTMIPAQ